MDNQPLQINSSNVSLTVSIGVSVYHQQDENLDHTISRADKALYHAKNAGRNKVICEQDIQHN